MVHATGTEKEDKVNERMWEKNEWMVICERMWENEEMKQETEWVDRWVNEWKQDKQETEWVDSWVNEWKRMNETKWKKDSEWMDDWMTEIERQDKYGRLFKRRNKSWHIAPCRPINGIRENRRERKKVMGLKAYCKKSKGYDLSITITCLLLHNRLFKQCG